METIRFWSKRTPPFTILSSNKETRHFFQFADGNEPGNIQINIKKTRDKNDFKMEHRIIQYSLDGEFIKVWDNTHQAAESGADTEGLIRNCLMGKRKSAKLNYQWVYYTPDYQQRVGRMERAGKTKKADKSRTDERIEEVAWDGTVIATYKDTTEAAQKSGYSQSYICNVIAGRIRHPKHKFRRAK